MLAYHACAEKDRIGLLRDNPQIGHRELRARAKGASEREGHFLVEENSLTGHKSQRACNVILIEVGFSILLRSKAIGCRAKGFLPFAEPSLWPNKSDIDPEQE